MNIIAFNEILAKTYLDAKEYVIEKGFAWELDWQVEQSFENILEYHFLREASWVILASGFRESIIRRVFPSISVAFLNWENAKSIVLNLPHCKSEALNYFKNERKIDAICQLAVRVSIEGFDCVKRKIYDFGLDYLQTFSFVGPITGLHLMKNLGIQMAKPDRHLTRIADATGINSVQRLCESIEQSVGDSLSEIDLVLWRYATLKHNYLSDFQFSEITDCSM